MFKIGNVEIKGRAILAPMAGFTSFGYRKFMEDFNPSLTYTEMISDMGLIYNNEETKSYLDFPKTKVPVSAQLFGSNPENLAKAASILVKLNPNVDIIDVNMACPVNKVTRNGGGSAILKTPGLAGRIIKAIKEVVNIPVTAKIRLGWDKNNINYLDVIKDLEDNGCDAIAIHARTAKELYIGSPHFDMLKDLRKKMRVPLIVSGNIYTLQDAINAIDITGADGVMIARGGVGNPTLIKQIDSYFKNKEVELDASRDEQIEYCKRLAKDLIDEKGEYMAMKVYRSIAPKFIVGFDNSKAYRIRLASELNTFADLENILSDFKKD